MVYTENYSYQEISQLILNFMNHSNVFNPELVFFSPKLSDPLDLLHSMFTKDNLPSEGEISNKIKKTKVFSCTAAVDAEDRHRIVLCGLDHNIFFNPIDDEAQTHAESIWDDIQPHTYEEL